MSSTKPVSTASLRTQSGSSLVSLMVATLLMAFVAIAMTSLVAVNTAEYHKLFNRTDSLTAAREGLDKLGRLVRMARALGDVQGETMVANNPYAAIGPGPTDSAFAVEGNNVNIAQVQAGTACNMSAKFPSIADYYYNSSTGTLRSTVSSWPWTDSMVNGAYMLSSKCLIVQVQCFDANGMPLGISTGLNEIAACDTYVFSVVPDTSRPGPTKWYQLQMACFPAPGNVTNSGTGLAPGVPVTLCSGLVGPLDPNTGEPMIFQYVSSGGTSGVNTLHTNFDSSTATGLQNENNLPLFKGVLVNLQIMNSDRTKKRPQVINLRSELYLRNNASATLLGR